MTECNSCGGCCDPVIMPMTMREMRERALVADDWERASTAFVLEHFTELSQREGMRRAPWMADAMRGKSGLLFQGRVIPQPVYYECDQYNSETRECMAYDDRPPFCRGFPFHGGPPQQGLLPPACEFKRDIGETPVSVDVMLSRRRGGDRVA